MDEIPTPPSEPKPFPWAKDSLASDEVRNFDKEDVLKGQKEKNELLWLKAYGAVVVVFLVFFALLFIGSLFSWSAHYLLPPQCHWLTADQLSKIQAVLFSGSIGGVVSLMAQKHLLK